MKLVYTGDFERLKEFGFEIDEREWFQFKDMETKAYIYVLPVSRELKWSASITISNYIPTIIYDLIQAGLVKKKDINE